MTIADRTTPEYIALAEQRALYREFKNDYPDVKWLDELVERLGRKTYSYFTDADRADLRRADEIMDRLNARYSSKYRQDQARVPAGSSTGGRWTDEGGGGARGAGGSRGGGTTSKPDKPEPSRSIFGELFGVRPAHAEETPEHTEPREKPVSLPKPPPFRQSVARPPTEHATTRQGVRFVAKHETFQKRAYDDGYGNQTIGYGHRIQPGESFPNTITQEQAEALLQKDMRIAETRVQKHVKAKLTYHQFDALTSLTYNTGKAAFREETEPGSKIYKDTELLKRLNKEDFEGAAEQITLYNKAYNHKTGKLEVSGGLTKRRAAEKRMFLHGVYP